MTPRNPTIQSWHHAPEHRFQPGQTYMITGATRYKQHFFPTSAKLSFLESLLLEQTEASNWALQAWATFSNHYHFIANAAENSYPLNRIIQRFHSDSARWINDMDGRPGRKVWYQYWDRCLTYRESYYARLTYINNNAVHHGLVSTASAYPFCSAGHFETQCTSAQLRKLNSFGWRKVKEQDNFTPILID